MSGPTILHLPGGDEVIEPDKRGEHHEVFRNMIRYIRGEDPELNCPVEMTRPFTVALNAAFESNGRPTQIPMEHVTREPRDNTVFTAINGITQTIERGYEEGKTYHELGIEWGRETPWVDTRQYTAFRPGF